MSLKTLETYAFDKTGSNLRALGIQSDGNWSAEQGILQVVGSFANVFDGSSVVLEMRQP